MRVVELADWVAAEGLADDRDVRPDGVHFTLDAATEITRTYLGPELIRSAL